MSQCRLTLITNMDYVSIDKLRTRSHALLLEERTNRQPYPGQGDKVRQLRGFGADSAWQTFDLDVPSLKFSSKDWDGNAIIIGDDGSARPLLSSVILEFEDGPRVDLWVSDSKRPIDIVTFEGDLAQQSELYEKTWQLLPNKVAEYWMAPNMPVLQYVPVPTARRYISEMNELRRARGY